MLYALLFLFLWNLLLQTNYLTSWNSFQCSLKRGFLLPVIQFFYFYFFCPTAPPGIIAPPTRDGSRACCSGSTVLTTGMPRKSLVQIFLLACLSSLYFLFLEGLRFLLKIKLLEGLPDFPAKVLFHCFQNTQQNLWSLSLSFLTGLPASSGQQFVFPIQLSQ